MNNINQSNKLSEQMMRGEVFSDQCPSREILKHVTNRWGGLVLVALLLGTHRFSDLRRKLSGVSEKMLAQTLQTLEADGFVMRVSYPVVPPHVEYSLTPLGAELAKQVELLVDWIEINLPRILDAQQTSGVANRDE
ncbi:MAG: transcriptional regulator [Methylotenera sp.]|jgi:DNA-binding HxlR family transcriptional regulator|uniref:Transcriptional regulator n=1 Tax=Methylotenera mobilis TaxID=359408 RepID=A0A351R9M8_9PROT|nr:MULTISPECIES: helix-turn-helix domain-containing protein [Methylotenera]HBA08749.1 transcriptional regulator [Methylotenera mobilis]MDP3211220.1 helix-turn-helix domain-containing protein [Methylotenera sp.]MDP3777954.1 helix-turn-helix domain-containing protein [Methylotenera sp.]PPC94112.1 MAG: transcriptional regulator [Methylotenera sp.]PPC96864.1 MAG: transcriptional regulator [Methylotenera sp.]